MAERLYAGLPNWYTQAPPRNMRNLLFSPPAGEEDAEPVARVERFIFKELVTQ